MKSNRTTPPPDIKKENCELKKKIDKLESTILDLKNKLLKSKNKVLKMEQKNLNLMADISKLKNTSEEIKILNLDNYRRK